MSTIDREAAAKCQTCEDGIHTPAVSGMPRPCPYCQRQFYPSSPEARIIGFASGADEVVNLTPEQVTAELEAEGVKMRARRSAQELAQESMDRRERQIHANVAEPTEAEREHAARYAVAYGVPGGSLAQLLADHRTEAIAAERRRQIHASITEPNRAAVELATRIRDSSFGLRAADIAQEALHAARTEAAAAERERLHAELIRLLNEADDTADTLDGIDAAMGIVTEVFRGD